MSKETNGSAGAAIQAWNSETKYTDFCLKVDSGEEFKCHKIMLARSSSFFRAMLENEFLETKNNCVKVAEFKAETVLHFLGHLQGSQRSSCKRVQPSEIHSRPFEHGSFL